MALRLSGTSDEWCCNDDSSHTRAHTHAHTYAHTYAHTHTHAHTRTYTHTHAHTRTHTHTHAHTLPRAPHGAGGRPSASALLGHSFFGGVRDVEQEVTCPPFDPGFEAGGISINDVHAHLHSIIEQDFQ